MNDFFVWLIDKFFSPITWLYKIGFQNFYKTYRRGEDPSDETFVLLGMVYNFLFYFITSMIILIGRVNFKEKDFAFIPVIIVYSAFSTGIIYKFYKWFYERFETYRRNNKNMDSGYRRLPHFKDLEFPRLAKLRDKCKKFFSDFFLSWYCRKSNKSAYAGMLRDLFHSRQVILTKLKNQVQTIIDLRNTVDGAKKRFKNPDLETANCLLEIVKFESYVKENGALLVEIDNLIERIRLRIYIDDSLKSSQQKCPELNWSQGQAEFVSNLKEFLDSLRSILEQDTPSALEDLSLQEVDLIEQIERAEQEVVSI